MKRAWYHIIVVAVFLCLCLGGLSVFMHLVVGPGFRDKSTHFIIQKHKDTVDAELYADYCALIDKKYNLENDASLYFSIFFFVLGLVFAGWARDKKRLADEHVQSMKPYDVETPNQTVNTDLAQAGVLPTDGGEEDDIQ